MKIEGRHVCAEHGEIYGRMREELASTPGRSIVKRRKGPAPERRLCQVDDCDGTRVQGSVYCYIHEDD